MQRLDMRKYLRCWMLIVFLSLWLNGRAQTWQDLDHTRSKAQPLSDIEYKIEGQGSADNGTTPLWLNANKHGLSSLDETNGYFRAAVERKLSSDSVRRWGVGYGLDMAIAEGYTSTTILQQAYVELRWLHGVLSIGSKERPMLLKNNALSSGSQTFGINARPIPQVRIAIDDYWIAPFANGWIRFKGHLAYGMMTDQNWQHEFTDKTQKYADNVKFHSKAGYIMIGNPERFLPFSVELGLEMACTFGGTVYRPQSDGTMQKIEGEGGLKSLWHAFYPSGSEAVESAHKNTAGNHVGSWLARFNYDTDWWRLSIYFDKYFEDQSGMFQTDYDGYGSGEEWNKWKDRRFILYDFRDIMFGAEFNMKEGSWLRDIVLEYLYTKYQSGSFLHEHSPEIPDHVGGNDNFYNHYLYTGWQHWGQVIGNPLYRSPLYNTDGCIEVEDSRFMAFHLGLYGEPTDRLAYRIRASWQEGLGTYLKPYTKKHHNFSFGIDATYSWPKDWTTTLSYGMDFGHILGNNYGAQLTIAKRGLLTSRKKQTR